MTAKQQHRSRHYANQKVWISVAVVAVVGIFRVEDGRKKQYRGEAGTGKQTVHEELPFR